MVGESENLSGFEVFWKIFPHCRKPPRSKKVLSRGLFKMITTVGRQTKIDGIPLNLKASPAQIIAAAKAYAAEIDKDYEQSDAVNRQYVPGAQIWLNQGRYEDDPNFEQEEDNVTHLRRRG